MYFHGARFSNYEAWLSDPTHIKPSAQVVWPIVGQEILNADVGGGFQGIQTTSGFFQLWRASGITSELQLYTTAIGGLILAGAMFFAGWFHYHKAAPKLEWFQNVESMLNHHLGGLLGLGSLGWAGHQIHISLPINKLLDAGVDPKEIPLPHELLLNKSIIADLYPSFSKGLTPFFTLNWGEYSDFLTFKGGLNPVTGGLWLSDTAHHHLAIAVLFLVAGHMYRTNWGLGHSMKEILEAHKGPFTGEGHVGLYEILTTSWHAQLGINLALFGSLSIIVAFYWVTLNLTICWNLPKYQQDRSLASTKSLLLGLIQKPVVVFHWDTWEIEETPTIKWIQVETQPQVLNYLFLKVALTPLYKIRILSSLSFYFSLISQRIRMDEKKRRIPSLDLVSQSDNLFGKKMAKEERDGTALNESQINFFFYMDLIVKHFVSRFLYRSIALLKVRESSVSLSIFIYPRKMILKNKTGFLWENLRGRNNQPETLNLVVRPITLFDFKNKKKELNSKRIGSCFNLYQISKASKVLNDLKAHSRIEIETEVENKIGTGLETINGESRFLLDLSKQGSSETLRKTFFLNSVALQKTANLFTMATPERTTKRTGGKGTFVFINKKTRKITDYQFLNYIKLKKLKKKKMDPKKIKEEISFLEWFIGFSEGEGSFGIKEKRPTFIINQADLKILLMIRKNLGFGKIYLFQQQNRTYARYTVTDSKSIQKLIALFNGNIQLEKVFKRFQKWVHCYNNLSVLPMNSSKILIKPRRLTSQIQLDQSWLAGFFDAEGGFYAQVGFTKPRTLTEPMKSRLRLKAYLDQKNEKEILLFITQLFGKKTLTVRNETKKFYRVELSSKKSIQLILSYFSNYKLRSKKHLVYAMWKKFANLFVKDQHLDNLKSENIKYFKKRISKIKYQNSEFKRDKTVLKRYI